jgi:hypothetical protein
MSKTYPVHGRLHPARAVEELRKLKPRPGCDFACPTRNGTSNDKLLQAAREKWAVEY